MTSTTIPTTSPDDTSATRAVSKDELRMATGGTATMPGMHKCTDVTLKRG